MIPPIIDCPKPHEGRWASFFGGDSEASWYACPYCGETWTVWEEERVR